MTPFILNIQKRQIYINKKYTHKMWLSQTREWEIDSEVKGQNLKHDEKEIWKYT